MLGVSEGCSGPLNNSSTWKSGTLFYFPLALPMQRLHLVHTIQVQELLLLSWCSSQFIVFVCLKKSLDFLDQSEYLTLQHLQLVLANLLEGLKKTTLSWEALLQVIQSDTQEAAYLFYPVWF